MKIVFLLLHDFRFASWNLHELLARHHFSKEYVRRIAKRGHEVWLLTMHQDLDEAEIHELDGGQIEIHPVDRRYPPFLRFGNCHSRSILRQVQEISPDIVHIHNYYVWGAAESIEVAKKAGAKVVAQYHGEPDRLFQLNIWNRSPYHQVDMYLVPSIREMNQVQKRFSAIPDRVKLFPNVGVDTDLFRRSQDKSKAPSLIYVGRLTNEERGKRPLMALQILRLLSKEIPSITMEFVGDGPAQGILKRYVITSGLQASVRFPGYIENSAIPPLISRAWISLNPILLDELNVYWDGFTKESLACETPIFAFSSKNATRVKEYGGLLPRKPKRAADELRDLLFDRDRLANMGRAGRKAILECCSWEKVIDQLEATYMHILDPEVHSR
jgi:glycosyltransferase involved in cell wall biosynthesis